MQKIVNIGLYIISSVTLIHFFCSLRIPETRHACTMCEDMTAKYVEWLYEFFFEVHDESGESMIISVHEEAVNHQHFEPLR